MVKSLGQTTWSCSGWNPTLRGPLSWDKTCPFWVGKGRTAWYPEESLCDGYRLEPALHFEGDIIFSCCQVGREPRWRAAEVAL